MFQPEEPRDGVTIRRRRELGDFLRDRRSRLHPSTMGLRSGGRRHVKGLRREEVAELAGISPATYAALEQGRLTNVTPRTLSRVIAVLGFDSAERQYIATLAAPNDMGTPFVDASIDTFIEFVRTYSLGCAHLGDEAMDVRAYNALADELFGFSRLEVPNLLVAMRDNAELRWRMIEPDWQATFTTMVGTFRLLYGTYPSVRAARVIEEMRQEPLFARLWCETGIRTPPLHTHTVDHPREGIITMQLLPLQIPSAPTNILMLTTNVKSG